MSSPLKFRKGWENENLAQFILSMVSFISKPISVSDDQGVDFFCTTYEIEKRDQAEYPMPKNSFAIQVKSNKKNFLISMKYLDQLEIPFLVGVIDQGELLMHVYSGRIIPALLSLSGLEPAKRNIELTDEFPDGETMALFKNDKILMKRMVTIPAESTKEKFKEFSEIISQECKGIQLDISTRRMGETTFYIGDPERTNPLIVAGHGSAQVFRKNFMRRLEETLANVKWILDNGRPVNPEEVQNELIFLINVIEKLPKSFKKEHQLTIDIDSLKSRLI